MNILINSARVLTKQQHLILRGSSRMSSSFLINEPKYSFLKDLGLSEKNQGVFAKHGEWFGDGEVYTPSYTNTT